MTMDYLTSNEKSRLLNLLFDSAITFYSTEKKFIELFSADRHAAVANELKFLCKQFISANDGVALIMSLYIVEAIRKGDVPVAKALFYDILVELEHAIRNDMFCAEQIKYALKEAKDSKKCSEAAHADEYRFHTAAKVFAFQLLTGSVSPSEKASTYVSKRQDEIDAILDTWEKSNLGVKETLADVTHFWISEKEKQQCSTLLRCGAVFDKQPKRCTALVLSTASPKVPSLPIVTGELQLLFSENKSLLFHNAASCEALEEVKRLLESAAQGPLNKAVQETFLGSMTKVVQHLGKFNTALLCDIAEHNPDVCAALFSKLSKSEAIRYIPHVLNSKARPEKTEMILLQATKALDQASIVIFITKFLERFRDVTIFSENDKEHLRSFLLVLHRLAAEISEENKGIHIPDSFKSDINQLIQESGTLELISLWEEIKK